MIYYMYPHRRVSLPKKSCALPTQPFPFTNPQCLMIHLSCNNMHAGFIVAWNNSLFFSITYSDQYFIVWIAYYSPTEGHVGYFQHVLAIINKVAKNPSMQIFMWTLHLFLKLKLIYILSIFLYQVYVNFIKWIRLFYLFFWVQKLF